RAAEIEGVRRGRGRRADLAAGGATGLEAVVEEALRGGQIDAAGRGRADRREQIGQRRRRPGLEAVVEEALRGAQIDAAGRGRAGRGRQAARGRLGGGRADRREDIRLLLFRRVGGAAGRGRADRGRQIGDVGARRRRGADRRQEVGRRP